jgi:predicted small lipoprotein YifL
VGRNVNRLSRVALVAALGAGLVLAGCGRKSGLDPPPAAIAPAPGTAESAPPLGEEQDIFGSLFGEPPPPAPPPQTPPPAGTPPPPKKTFFLDFLLAK